MRKLISTPQNTLVQILELENKFKIWSKIQAKVNNYIKYPSSAPIPEIYMTDKMMSDQVYIFRFVVPVYDYLV